MEARWATTTWVEPGEGGMAVVVEEEGVTAEAEGEEDEVSLTDQLTAEISVIGITRECTADEADGGRGRGRGGHGHGGGGDHRPPIPENTNARLRKMVVKFADEDVSYTAA